MAQESLARAMVDKFDEKMEMFGQEQFKLGQLKLEQELAAREQRLKEEHDRQVEQLRQQIEQEQERKNALILEAQKQADEREAALKEQIRQEMEGQLAAKMAEVDSKHRQENSKLKNRIDLMRGNYEAMQSNLHMNEHIRKVQQ